MNRRVRRSLLHWHAHAVRRGLCEVVVAAGVVVTLIVAMPFARIALAEEGTPAPPARDEFGVVPPEPRDQDLVLPDPRLDRTWPPPPPEAKPFPPDKMLDEDETNPFDGEDGAPPADAKPGPKKGDVSKAFAPPDPAKTHGDWTKKAAQAARDSYLIPDEGSAVDPAIPEDDDAYPSPLDEDDKKYEQETSDPTEW